MTPFFAGFTFINAWFIVMFVTRALMHGKKLWLVCLANTALAAAVTLAIHLVIKSGWIPVHNYYVD